MWRRFMSRPLHQFSTTTQRSFTTFQYQSSQYTRRLFQKPYTAPVTLGFLGWLFGSSVDYAAIRKDIADCLEDYDWDDSMFTHTNQTHIRILFPMTHRFMGSSLNPLSMACIGHLLRRGQNGRIQWSHNAI